MKKIIVVILFLFPLHFLNAQAISPTVSLDIQPITNPIKVDGKLEETVWKELSPATNFWKQAPVDGEQATKQTEVRMGYDDKFVYLSAVCWDDPNYVIQTLKRDNFGESDVFAVVIDPVNQQANAYAFAVNAKGAQSELLISPNSSDESWDNKWFVAVQNESNKWTVEMAIPFKTLRFKAGLSEWGINFVRLDPGTNETHVWSPVPRQFDFFDLGYLGNLAWDKAPQKVGKNIALIPYASVAKDKFYQPTERKAEDFSVGGDAKVAISPTLNLDLTFNPDFSQVEVDQQVTNLSRFNIFFPERRQFFLENADIFNQYGQYADRPFYSRRIGLDAGGNPIPILYGIRLSGNVSSKSRIGLINMQTKDGDNRFGQNYSAVTFQQRLWKRSFLKGIFLNRQAYQDNESIATNYGRNLGGEFNFSTPDGKIRTNIGLMQSYKNGFTNKNQHLYGRFDYDGQNFRTFLTVQHLGGNYFADMGFNGRLVNFNPETGESTRVGYTQIGNMLNYYIYPKESKKVNFHWAGVENFVYINDNANGLTEWYTRLRHFIFFQNTSQLRFRLNNNYVDLLFPFGITETPLPANSYNMTEFNVQFNTDVRKLLNTQMFIVYGQFYNGTKLTYRGSVSYRAQPWGNFTLGLERNDIWLPELYGNLHFTLATARMEINFATNLFWTTFLQYNTQRDNFNINSRFQWRFAPMSDLFFVYTDNYAIEDLFGPKSRSFVLKFNYWLTL